MVGVVRIKSTDDQKVYTTISLQRCYHLNFVINIMALQMPPVPLRWRHNGHDGVSNRQPHHCLLNRLFGCRSKKTSKLHVTGLCVRGIHRWPVNSPHKWLVTQRKMFPFDDVIMHKLKTNYMSSWCLQMSNRLLPIAFDFNPSNDK